MVLIGPPQHHRRGNSYRGTEQKAEGAQQLRLLKKSEVHVAMKAAGRRSRDQSSRSNPKAQIPCKEIKTKFEI